MTKRIVLYFLSAIFIIFIVIAIGISYAFWRKTLTQNINNEIVSGCFNVEMINQQNAINLENAFPLTDEEGIKLTPFTFTITNTCKTTTSYRINLEMLEGTTLHSRFVAVQLNDGKIRKLELLKEVDKTLSTSVESRILSGGTLNANESKEFSLRIWMDKDVTMKDDTQNKIFKSKIVVTNEATFHKTDEPVAFATDSWETINKAIKTGNTSKYHVGDIKNITISEHINDCATSTGSGGTYNCSEATELEKNVIVRIANMSECTNGETSETACGFVLEFVDIIEAHNFNIADSNNINGTNKGGWNDSKIRKYLNETFYNSLSEDLKDIITSTTVISSNGTNDEKNLRTTDKIYLLSATEVLNGSLDNANSTTKQLDYYKDYNAKKEFNDISYDYWLRSSNSTDNTNFLYIDSEGTLQSAKVSLNYGISPAFRLDGKGVVIDENGDFDENDVEDENYSEDNPIIISFSQDSWTTIAEAVKRGKTSKYNIGDTKRVLIKEHPNGLETCTGTYPNKVCIATIVPEQEVFVRIANKSKCEDESMSETSCGFVIEFVDIIEKYAVNGIYGDTNYDSNKGGWKGSSIRTYINSTLFNSLPEDLQSVISDTNVISSHGGNDSSNFYSEDKLYLLSTKEIWGKDSSGNDISYDTTSTLTRQLDYYEYRGVLANDAKAAIKNYNNQATEWWTRSAYSGKANTYRFFYVKTTGLWEAEYATRSYGISPAFKVG